MILSSYEGNNIFHSFAWTVCIWGYILYTTILFYNVQDWHLPIMSLSIFDNEVGAQSSRRKSFPRCGLWALPYLTENMIFTVACQCKSIFKTFDPTDNDRSQCPQTEEYMDIHFQCWIHIFCVGITNYNDMGCFAMLLSWYGITSCI